MKGLPTVNEDAPAAGTAPSEAPQAPDTSSARLVVTLAAAGALAGLVIVLVFGWADPRIQAHRAAALRAAVNEVLSEPASYRSLYVTPDGLVETPPPGVDTVSAEKVFIGFDEAGEPVGYAITGAEAGYQDLIHLIFGFDPTESRVLGMKVLESKETPGLGDKIIKDESFVTGFEGARTPLVGVKANQGAGDPHEVDMITGATISSRTVIGTINHRIEDVGTAVADHAASDPQPPASADLSGLPDESGASGPSGADRDAETNGEGGGDT